MPVVRNGVYLVRLVRHRSVRLTHGAKPVALVFHRALLKVRIGYVTNTLVSCAQMEKKPIVTEMDIVPVNKVISIHNKTPPPIGGGGFLGGRGDFIR